MPILSPALIRYHATRLRQSPATGVFLTCGWVAGVLLTFISGQLIATNRASLDGFFTYLPWVMAILIPALAMPTASETARGVTERLLTLPHTVTQRLFSRFLVHWALLGAWLLGFWPLVATLYYLGHPDLGPILTGFLGSFLLAAPMLALSLAICLRAKSAVGGLLGSLTACLLLMLAGTNTVTSWFSGVPGMGWLSSISYLTLLGAFTPFTVGLLNISALILLVGLTFFFLGFGLPRRAGLRAMWSTILPGAILILFALLPGLGWLQIDTTAESLHTPSASTVATLKDLPTPVTFTLYLSQNNPDVPPEIHQTVHTLTNLLRRLRAEVPERVELRVSNVDSSTAAAIAALQAGATEQSLPTGTTYFAALTATIASKTTVIPRLDPTRQPVQEYDLMTLVSKAQQAAPPVVTILSANPEHPTWQPALSDAFTIENMSKNAIVTEIPSTTSVLVLPDDATLPPTTITAIRHYLDIGGNILLLTNAQAQSQPQGADQPLSHLLPEWGITWVSDTLIADPTQAALATQTDARGGGAGAMSYPYWLQLGAKNLDTTLPFTSGISHLFIPQASPLALTTSPTAVTLNSIISTSAYARTVSLTTFQSTPPELANNQLPTATATQTIAAMATGPFSPESTHSGTLLVVADTDWLTPTSLTQAPDNLTLLTSMLHYLSGQSTLTQLRAKGATPRTLTRVEDMANRLTQQTAKTEQKIATRLYEVNQNRTSDDDLANAQEEAFTLRQQLRDIRSKTRHRLQMLENALLILNLTLMPTILGILFFLQRRRQRLKATSTL